MAQVQGDKRHEEREKKRTRTKKEIKNAALAVNLSHIWKLGVKMVMIMIMMTIIQHYNY
jgi:hypothetical protein